MPAFIIPTPFTWNFDSHQVFGMIRKQSLHLLPEVYFKGIFKSTNRQTGIVLIGPGIKGLQAVTITSTGIASSCKFNIPKGNRAFKGSFPEPREAV
jgi:hypothetical protein